MRLLVIRAIARRLTGNPAGAVEILAPFCERTPDPSAFLQLGLARREAGDEAGAAAALRRAVELAPSSNDVWRALAELLAAMGDTEGADRAFAAFLRCSANDPRITEPAAALRENRLADAERLLRAHLGRFPSDIAALHMLSEVAVRTGRLQEAEALLQRCLALAPGYREARHNYAVVLLRRNRPGAALEECDRLLAADAGRVELRKLRAAILLQIGAYDEAIAIYRDLLDTDAAQPGIWANLGHALRMVGRGGESADAYRRCIALAPDYGEAWWNLANLKTFPISDEEVEEMQRRIGTPAPGADRAPMHFALGKALEDRGRFEEAFRHFDTGNRLRRAALRYDPAAMSAMVKASRALFTRDFFDARAGSGCPAEDPIFIVGLPRSGSTLVEQILASHPAVEGTAELQDVADIAREIAGRPDRYPAALAEVDAARFEALGRSYLERTRIMRRSGRPRFIDKMPNNFAHAGLIHLMLPNARIIDVRRHPLACGFSIYKHLFASGQHFAYSLVDIGRYYADYVELMAHFDDVLPGRILRVHYEALVEDTEAEVRRLLDYCGLPFDPACLAFHANPRPVATPSSEQVRTPIFREALDHWRRYEAWLGPLGEALGSLATDYSWTRTSPGGTSR